MTKSISVKELRTQMPKIRRGLKRGDSFEIFHRSKLMGRLSPPEPKKTPKRAFAIFANPPKKWQLPGSENAVTTIRRERGNR